jgi:uncharacterized membrane protein YdjX (TVP38/TMEM64 family)
MKKGIVKVSVIAVWVGLLIFLYRQGLITNDMDAIREMLGKQPDVMMELFLLFSMVRVVFFIPGAVFMVLGGLCFGPVEGFLLSMLSTVISESVIFIVGRCFGGGRLHEYLDKNHKGIVRLTDKYRHEFLALGIICPVASTDMVCLIAAMLKFDYKSYIFTVVLANIPMTLIYSYLGSINFNVTGDNMILVVVIILVLVYTVSMWFRNITRV